jgi:hypothetical protein
MKATLLEEEDLIGNLVSLVRKRKPLRWPIWSALLNLLLYESPTIFEISQ